MDSDQVGHDPDRDEVFDQVVGVVADVLEGSVVVIAGLDLC